MELPANRFRPFLKSPDKSIKVFLIYGPDEGLVRELGKALCLSIVDSLNDPFCYGELSASDLSSDPAKLMDELTAISMMGGDRVVRLRGATGNSKNLIEPALDLDLDTTTFVIEAGDIRKDSALVKKVKSAPHGAVTPCFHDKAQDVTGLIKEILGAAGLSASRDVEDYLCQNLGSDRSISRQELDKLVLYMGNEKRPVTLEDVQVNIGDSSSQTVFDIIDATLSGNLQALERRMNKAFSAGESPIAFLRLIQGQLKQLHKAAALIDAGQKSGEAMKKAGIPFFNQKKAQVQLSGKTGAHMATCLDITLNAEIDCKTTGYPDETLCRRALMRIAMASRRR
ncbi:DNA polymerase III subunit delta [Sneathiella marina]|uniref:DNA-directed DNA polymerase n=1 Tax=Sneathiella marina TaxID=2950108 RepID=A0ABY4W301_9PROT|nr:DNA polymerase III subunit delta [Sneathiella marina]USG61428.1 DNA polymerase III subunit delta [Sneathiella marina]